MIANEKNAIKVPVENIEKLAEAIVQMSNTFSNYNRKNISVQIKEIADNRVVANQLVDAYKQVILSNSMK